MKRYLLLCILCVYAFAATLADTNLTSAFRMINTADVQANIATTYYTDVILPINNVGSISGLSLDGRTILNSDTSLVRVLLLDNQNQAYLVYEDFFLTHQDSDFQDVAFETTYLDSIVPVELRIIVRDASLQLYSVNYALWNTNTQPRSRKQRALQQQTSQEEYLIDKWNEYNAQHQNYWVAGKTPLSDLSYSEKKAALGAIDDAFVSDGLEYYIGGFFVVRSRENTSEEQEPALQTETVTSSSYVESFDWRNRHGRNWMTSVKSQIEPKNTTGNGGCWVFGTIAAIESAINLQFNQLLDYDLSEQEVGTCASGSIYSGRGGFPWDALYFIKNNGVVTEECMPFQNADTLECSNKCNNPNDRIFITGYKRFWNNTKDEELKHYLINKGPIVSGFSNIHTNHVMCLCGYGTIKAGDSITFVPYENKQPIGYKIEEGNALIGQTYWIYKNSYGANSHINGYYYAVYEKPTTKEYTCTIEGPITSMLYDSTDVVCEDRDGDGYYFWGLGKKPCPVCCPDIPDGDDSDPSIAQMDEYGNFAPYVFPYTPIEITSNTIWGDNDTICGNVIISNNATLTIRATITLNPQARIVVNQGATLIVDAGCILNSYVVVEDTGSLILRNNAILQQSSKDLTDVQKGGKLLIEKGQILIP